MHEMSLALSVVEIAEEIAKTNSAEKVTVITVDIGDLSGVEQDALLFCFEACAKKTLCEGSHLSLNQIKAKATCPSCDIDFSPSSAYFVCPECDGPAGIVSGDQFCVRSVEVS